MKRLAPYALAILLCLNSIIGFSQNPTTTKPKQFSSFPDVINCTEAELSKVFTSSTGQSISLSFSDNFLFSGSVIDKAVKYSNLQSANIKSPAFNNSIFNISKRINDDNSITYVGRIINTGFFDGYELKKDLAGNYQLIKIETDRVIQDCLHL